MNVWNALPLFRLLLPFVVGVLIATFTEVRLDLWQFLLVFPGLFIFYRFTFKFRYRWVFGAYLTVLIFAFALLWSSMHPYKIQANYFEQYLAKDAILLIELLEQPEEKARTWKSEVKVLQVNGKPVVGKMLVYIAKDSLQYNYGDRLWVQGSPQKVKPPANPSEFHYQRYLSFHRIHYQLYVPNNRLQKQGEGGGLIRKAAINYRKQLLQTLENHSVSGEELAIASALLLGFKQDLQTETVHAFASSGAMHVLAVSGLHVGIIYLIFHSLFLFMERKRWSKILKAILLIIILWGYALLTGLSPSVMRAATMFSFVIVGKSISRKTNIYNTLAASAFCLLIINPNLLFEVGFQLSYLAVLGIVFLQNELYVLLTFKNWLFDKMWAISCVSIAAQMATFPLGLLYFHQFPNYFLLSNLAVIPLATIILQLGVGLFAVQSIPFLAEPLAWLLKLALSVLLSFVQWVQSLPQALSSGIDISIAETYLLYILLFFLAFALVKKEGRWLVYSLSLLLLITAWDTYEDYEQAQQTELLVYKVNKHTAIAFIQGTEAVVLMDAVLLQDESKQRFHLKHHWWNRGLKQIDKRALTDSMHTDFLFKEGNHIQFADKRILLLDAHYQEQTTAFPIEIDFILLTGSFKGKLKEVLQTYKTNQIILDASLNYYQKQKWEKECEGVDLMQ